MNKSGALQKALLLLSKKVLSFRDRKNILILNDKYSFSFLPRVANLDFSSLSVYVTVGCSHSPPYYLKQQIAVIYSSIPFRICPRHPRKPKTLFSCGKSFSRPAAYRIHRVLTSPWFSPSCPKAEVSLFCDGS